MLGRTWFLVVMLVGGLAAVGWAVYGSRLPPADFTFFNESEVESVDPAIITGQPEGRIARSLFEGLTRPRADNNQAEPGVAERWEISDDGRTYTFHLARRRPLVERRSGHGARLPLFDSAGCSIR